MKIQTSIPLFLLILLASPLVPSAVAQTPFTYQGKLENNGAPLTGNVTIQLGLYAIASGGSPIRQETKTNVAVTNGLFTVTPSTFLVGDFPGAARWLQIDVSENGGNTFIPLTPRQQVTYTPYAMYAVQAGTAASVSGNIQGSQIIGSMNPLRLSNGTTNATINFSPTTGAPFAVGSTTKVSYLNTDLFDGLDSTAFLRTIGGTLTGNLNIPNAATTLDFGSNTRQMLNLWGGGAFGIGVQSATLYERSNTNFGWYRGGSHSDDMLSPGTGGVSMMTLSDSLLMLRPGVPNSTIGQGPIRLGFGDFYTGDPSDPFVWIGESDTDDQMDIRADKINFATRSGAGNSISFGATTGQHVVLFENGSDTYGVGVQSSTEYFRSGDQFAWFKDGTHSDTAFDPGSGGTTLMTLSGTSNLALPTAGKISIGNTNSISNYGYGLSLKSNLVYLKSASDVNIAVFEGTGNLNLTGAMNAGGPVTSGGIDSGMVVKNRNDLTKTWTTYARNSGGTDQLAFYTSSGNRDVAALSPNGDMYLVGALSTSVLTIRGGADVAEPFDMTGPEEMEPGSVVVIDENNPGKLKLSSEECDTRVAGIISGAGGVKPGLRLHQEGVMEGEHHVALSGRVYVKADATGGAIKPGDLLTTSSHKGRAMKVTDHHKSQGAILGKAMTPIDESTGLVLVLVTLQ